MLRLRLLQGSLLISNFQPAGEVAWSYDMPAFRELHDSTGGISESYGSRKRSEARRSHSGQTSEVKLPRRVREKLQRAHSQSTQRERERRGRKHRSLNGTNPDAGKEEHESPVRSEQSLSSATKLDREARQARTGSFHSQASEPKGPMSATTSEQKQKGAPPLPGFLASCCQSAVRPDCECNIRLLAR